MKHIHERPYKEGFTIRWCNEISDEDSSNPLYETPTYKIKLVGTKHIYCSAVDISDEKRAEMGLAQCSYTATSIKITEEEQDKFYSQNNKI